MWPISIGVRESTSIVVWVSLRDGKVGVEAKLRRRAWKSMCFGKKPETCESPILLDEVRRDDCHTERFGRLLGTTMWDRGILREES